VRRDGDLVDALRERPIAQRPPEDPAVAGHHGERIVQLVRHPGEERAHIGELVALARPVPAPPSIASAAQGFF
jgi:hypothetical protein